MAMDTDVIRLDRREEPVCSVCIANYNGGSVLEACLDSIFRQNFPHPLEVIVHDDASTDGSADMVCKKYPDVRLIRSDNNVGFCVSNNRMAAVAKGKYILLLNNDAVLHDDALSTLYRHTVAESMYGIIGLPQYDMQTGDLVDIGNYFDPFLNPVPNKNRSRHNVGMVIGACMWMPVELWKELRGFPEWFESVAEDMYLCCLARLKGYPVIALGESGFNHWLGKSLGGARVVDRTLRTTYRRRALSERNKSCVMLICYPGFLVWLLIPLHILLLTVEGVLLSVMKRDRKIWTEIYRFCLSSLWTNREKIKELRRQIQTRKRISSRVFYSVLSPVPHKLRLLVKYGVPTVQ